MFSEYIQSFLLLHVHGGVSWGYRRVCEKGQPLQVPPFVPLGAREGGKRERKRIIYNV